MTVEQTEAPAEATRWLCEMCGFIYDPEEGDPDSGIPPGATFDYEVPINSSGQWGTYWVHAHASVRSLRSPAPSLTNRHLYPRANTSTASARPS